MLDLLFFYYFVEKFLNQLFLFLSLIGWNLFILLFYLFIKYTLNLNIILVYYSWNKLVNKIIIIIIIINW